VVHSDRERSGRCLSQSSARIGVDVTRELGFLLARRTHPSAEPLLRKVGLQGTEAPGAGPNQHLSAQSAELLDGDGDGVRAEQPAALRRAALVGIECGGDAGVQGIGRGQDDAADDG
jgi:hypothetical protein